VTDSGSDTCKNNQDDKEKGHDNGYTQLKRFRSTYLGAISDRLESENPGLDLSDDEVYSMQEMCGFETIVRGSSPWCGIFTHKEWQSFEYARDVTHYYRSGPGNIYARAMGWLWLNATTNLLLEGPRAVGPLYFSFVHDGDIVPMLAALGLFEDVKDLPVSGVWEERRWKTSQITPMGGRIILERLTCGKERYVRFNVNDGIVPLDGCGDGPGASCELQRFGEYVKSRGESAGDFRSVCGLDESAPDRLTFLRQPGFPGPKA
jgi:acid phosphatase